MLTEIQTTIKVYQSADMLGIEPLKLATTRKIIDMIATKANHRFLEMVLETLFSAVPKDSLMRDAIVDACAHNYNKVMSHPKPVALLQEHEARIWRLTQQNYTTQVGRIEHYVQDTVVEVCKQVQCINPDCESDSMAVSLPELHWSPDGIMSGDAVCQMCYWVFDFDVHP